MMDIWNLLEYAAWAIAAYLLIYIVFDAWRVGTEYDENLLISSREGSDELLEHMRGGDNE